MAQVELMIGYMKREPRFEVSDEKSEEDRFYSFTYDDTTCSLYFIENRKRFEVTNPGTVLYGIAQAKPYLEVNLRTAGERPPMFIIEQPMLIFS